MNERDIIDRHERIEENKDLYARFAQMMEADDTMDTARQMLQKMTDSADSDAIGETEDALVTFLWTSGEMSERMYSLFLAYNEKLSTQQTLMLVSGLFLSLWEYFDERKMMLLAHNIHSLDRKVLARSLTFYCLLLIRHEEEQVNIPSTRTEMEKWKQDADIMTGLSEVQRFYLSTCKTRETFNIFMKKVVPNINPNSDEKSKKEARKLFKMIGIEDADLNLGLFLSLKDNNFFTVLSHWFCPFSLERRELAGAKDSKETLDIVVDHPSLCDIDKYALTFTLLGLMGKGNTVHVNIPESIQEKLKSPSHEYNKINMEEELSYRLNFQMLYRFFNFSKWGNEMLNPFKKLNPDFIENSTLHPYLDQNFYTSLLEKAAERGDSRKLEALLLAYDKQHLEDTAETLCIRGSIYRNKHMENEARECIEKAYKMGFKNLVWIHSQLAACNEALCDYEEALEHYKALEELEPQNSKNTLNVAQMLIQMERWEDALKKLFQLEFEKKHLHSVTRAIAWCSLKTHNLDRAQRYYKKLLDWEGKRNWDEVLNAGHVAWALGDTKEAVRLYRAFMDNTENAINVFKADHDLLINLGIKEEDYQKMITLF